MDLTTSNFWVLSNFIGLGTYSVIKATHVGMAPLYGQLHSLATGDFSQFGGVRENRSLSQLNKINSAIYT